MDSLDYLELKEANGVIVEDSLWLGVKGSKGHSGLVIDISGLGPVFSLMKNLWLSFCWLCFAMPFPDKFSSLSPL